MVTRSLGSNIAGEAPTSSGNIFHEAMRHTQSELVTFLGQGKGNSYSRQRRSPLAEDRDVRGWPVAALQRDSLFLAFTRLLGGLPWTSRAAFLGPAGVRIVGLDRGRVGWRLRRVQCNHMLSKDAPLADYNRHRVAVDLLVVIPYLDNSDILIVHGRHRVTSCLRTREPIGNLARQALRTL